MFGRNCLRRCSLYILKGEENAHDKKRYEFLAVKRLPVDGAKAFATAVSAVIFCIGLFHNELKKLKRDVKPLHDIFDFEKKPNYLGNSSEVSTVKKYLKNLLESKSIWDVIPIRTILKCTQSNDPSIKRKALEVLSQRSCLEDADCLMISQSIDFPTSLFLARSLNVDQRFFRPPLKLPPSEHSLETELTNLVDGMPRLGDPSKHQQFIQRTRKRRIRASSHVDKTVMLGFETFDDMENDSQKSFESQVERHLLQAILKYSEDDLNCKHLIGRGILAVLRRANEKAPEDLFLINLTTKIINNLLLNGTNPELLFDSGWFHVIIKWTHSKLEDVRSNAMKLVVNMDLSYKDGLARAYDNRVLLLHPTHRNHGPIRADVVFVHGIRGGPVKTWRQRDKTTKNSNGKNNNKSKSQNNNNNKSLNNISNNNNNSSMEEESLNRQLLNSSDDHNAGNGIFIVEDDESSSSDDHSQCWPKDWLPQDLHDIRILSVDYDTQLTHWTSNDHIERKTLKEQAELLLDSLSAVDVGRRPVVLVGHSMGGLLIKQMLCMAAERQMELTNRVKGIVFYSVPHRGSYLINRTKNASYIIHPTDTLLQLAEGSNDLKDLHEKFSDLMEQGPVKVRSFTEGASTTFPFYLKATVVSPRSSEPGFGDFFVMKDHDHVTICKPKSKDSLLYKLTRDFIKQCLDE